jgi:hypothetical protein
MGVLFGREALSSRGRWLAIVGASIVMQFSYWPTIFALAAAHGEDPIPGELVLFGMAFVPAVFLVLAFASRNPRAPGSVLKAMGLFLLVGAPVALINPVVGLVAGFGAGGIVTLRRSELPRALRARVIALAGGCLYLFVLLVVAQLGDFALVTGAAIPFSVLGIAEEVLLGRHEAGERRARAEDPNLTGDGPEGRAF